MSTIRSGVEYQGDGWPVGTSEATKTAITRAVKEILRYRGPMPTSTLLQIVKTESKGWDTRWEPGPLLDYQFATIERACRAADCEQVWRAPPSF